MKPLVYISLLLSLSLNAAAQVKTVNTLRNDHAAQADNNTPLCILNEKIAPPNTHVNPGDILQETILKTDSSLVAKYGEGAIKGALIITTWRFGIDSYEAKLSKFSKEYAKYIQSHDDDSRLFYFLNGQQLSDHDRELVITLYNLPAASIRSVTFNENEPGAEGMTPLVSIKTN